MALLFGNTAGRNQSKNLVEFRAGKMQMKGNVVHAETRKGLVYVHQTESDSLMHFCWKDRVSGTVEDDLIIFPDDVEFKRVQQCTTGRVYLLKFKSSNRKLFFWMQDPNTDKDVENCAKVNEYLNNPPAPGSARSGGSTPGALGADIPGDADLQNLLSTMSQQQFMQLLGGMSGVGGMANLSNYLSAHGLGSQFGSGSSSQSARRSGQSSAVASVANASAAATTAATTATTTASTTTAAAAVTTTSTATTSSSTASSTSTTVTATPSLASAATASATTAPSADAISSQVQLSDLQSILSGISVQPGEDQSKPPASVATVNPLSGVSATAVDLSTAMTTEALQPILSNPEFLQRLQDLLPQTGGIGGTASAPAEQLQSTVQSPQFQQAVSMFSAALQSGQLGPLLQQFGLSDEVVNAAAQGDMETFINVLQASHNEGAVKKEKEDDDDDEMALD